MRELPAVGTVVSGRCVTWGDTVTGPVVEHRTAPNLFGRPTVFVVVDAGSYESGAARRAVLDDTWRVTGV